MSRDLFETGTEIITASKEYFGGRPVSFADKRQPVVIVRNGAIIARGWYDGHFFVQDSEPASEPKS